MKMRLTAHILFGLWLVAGVFSNVLRIHYSLYDNLSLELIEKDPNEKSRNEKDGEKEKESEDKSEKKSEKETEDKFFEFYYGYHLITTIYCLQLRNTIHIANEQYICTFSIELESPPPEFLL